jgi:cell division protein FtsW
MTQRTGLVLFLVTLLLAFIGIFVLYETSTYTALLNIGDKYYYVKNQLVYLVAGIVLSLIISRLNYKRFHQFALPLLVTTIILLVVVFLPGIGLSLKGSHRWINLQAFIFQPSEVLKVTLTIYLAAWLSNKEKGRFLAFLMLFLFATFLVVIEPDMGTAIIIAVTSMTVYFLSDAPLKELFIIVGVLFFGGLFMIKAEPYRVARLTSFQNVTPSHLQNTSYHLRQILVALGSGGVKGVGIGNSIQKYGYLPENTTDSIFAIYAEETGFVGSILLLVVLFFQLILGFFIAARAPDKFGRLLAAGIVTFLATQMILNIGSQVVLVPLTGVPLPFISYGGTSLIINFAAIGILLSIAHSHTVVQRHGRHKK